MHDESCRRTYCRPPKATCGYSVLQLNHILFAALWRLWSVSFTYCYMAKCRLNRKWRFLRNSVNRLGWIARKCKKIIFIEFLSNHRTVADIWFFEVHTNVSIFSFFVCTQAVNGSSFEVLCFAVNQLLQSFQLKFTAHACLVANHSFSASKTQWHLARS